MDQLWREMMESANESPACLAIARDKERLAILAENNRLLDEIQKVGDLKTLVYLVL